MPVPLKQTDRSSPPVSSISMTLHGKPPKYSSRSEYKSRVSGNMSRSSSLLASHSRSYVSPGRSSYFGSYLDDHSSRDGSESRDTSFASSSSYNTSSLTRNYPLEKPSSKDNASSNNAYRRSSPVSLNFDYNEFLKFYSPDNYVPGTYRSNKSESRLSSSLKSSPSDSLEVRASKATLQPRYSASPAPSAKSSPLENSSLPVNFNSNSAMDGLSSKVKSMHLTDENHNMVGYSVTDGEDKYFADHANNVSRSKKCYNCPSPSREAAVVVKGLRNVGNTCYMNSVLQCLNRTPPLVSYILNQQYIADLNNTKCAPLFRAFAELIEKMNDSVSRSPISAQSFKNELQQYARQFVGRNQHDAQEFLRYLLQGLHEAINQGEKKITSARNLDDLSESEKAEESWRQYNVLERSKIIDFFVGQLKSSLKCTVCEKCSNTFEIFWDVSLPLPDLSSRTTLRDCLIEFTKEEVLDGKNAPVCANCKKPRKCTKRFHIQKLPKILVLHLKRFTSYSTSSSYYSSRWTRSSVNVDFPVTLDMTEFASTRELSSIKYSLYGFSCHSGTLDAGHYVAYCKNIRTDEWFEFNDSEVIPVSVSEVLKKQPYLLFYHQIGSASEIYHV